MSVTVRYLLSQTSRPLGVAMLVGLMVMLAERLVRLLDVTLGKKNSFSLVFEMLGYLVPHYLGAALPAAFFIGLLFGINRLSKESEIDAFLAAGIGLHQLARPLLILSVVFMGIAFVLVGYVQPHTRYAYRTVLNSVKNVEIFYLAEEGVFMRAGKRTFILEKLSRRDGEFEHIFLYHNKGRRGSETVTAHRGSLIELPGRSRPVLRLEGGHRLEINARVNPLSKTALPRQTASEFQRVDTPLGADGPVRFRTRGQDERELTLPELLRRQDNPPQRANKHEMAAELHRRIIQILGIFFLPLLAVPFAVGRRRGQRPYRFGAALLILIVFHEIFEQGALAVGSQGLSPYLMLWAPFLVFAIFTSWQFYRVCFSIKPGGFEPLIEKLSEFAEWIGRKVAKVRSAR
jgi:lipopolysaccharide export system permease protein